MRGVSAVDLNLQNHLVEPNRRIARSECGRAGFPLRSAGTRRVRRRVRRVRDDLAPAARAYWDARHTALARGVLNAGVTERFISGVVRAMRLGVHRRARIQRILACGTIHEQQAMFASEWDTWRWRGLFRALLNPVVFRRTYDPGFFENVEKPSFAAHFRARADYTLTHLPVANNYFLHHMFTGVYPVGVPGGVPLYLDPSAAGHLTNQREALTLVDGAMTDYLRTVPARSVTGFALSNICEWLTPAGIDDLFAQVVADGRAGRAGLLSGNSSSVDRSPRPWLPPSFEEPRARRTIDGARPERRAAAVCDLLRAREDAPVIRRPPLGCVPFTFATTARTTTPRCAHRAASAMEE